MADLPASNVKRLTVAGAGDIRISAEAVDKAIGAAEAFLSRLGQRAGSVARSNGRKTIMPEDIEAARGQLLP